MSPVLVKMSSFAQARLFFSTGCSRQEKSSDCLEKANPKADSSEFKPLVDAPYSVQRQDGSGRDRRRPFCLDPTDVYEAFNLQRSGLLKPSQLSRMASASAEAQTGHHVPLETAEERVSSVPGYRQTDWTGMTKKEFLWSRFTAEERSLVMQTRRGRRRSTESCVARRGRGGRRASRSRSTDCGSPGRRASSSESFNRALETFKKMCRGSVSLRQKGSSKPRSSATVVTRAPPPLVPIWPDGYGAEVSPEAARALQQNKLSEDQFRLPDQPISSSTNAKDVAKFMPDSSPTTEQCVTTSTDERPKSNGSDIIEIPIDNQQNGSEGDESEDSDQAIDVVTGTTDVANDQQQPPKRQVLVTQESDETHLRLSKTSEQLIRNLEKIKYEPGQKDENGVELKKKKPKSFRRKLKEVLRRAKEDADLLEDFTEYKVFVRPDKMILKRISEIPETQLAPVGGENRDQRAVEKKRRQNGFQRRHWESHAQADQGKQQCQPPNNVDTLMYDQYRRLQTAAPPPIHSAPQSWISSDQNIPYSPHYAASDASATCSVSSRLSGDNSSGCSCHFRYSNPNDTGERRVLKALRRTAEASTAAPVTNTTQRRSGPSTTSPAQSPDSTQAGDKPQTGSAPTQAYNTNGNRCTENSTDVSVVHDKSLSVDGRVLSETVPTNRKLPECQTTQNTQKTSDGSSLTGLGQTKKSNTNEPESTKTSASGTIDEQSVIEFRIKWPKIGNGVDPRLPNTVVANAVKQVSSSGSDISKFKRPQPHPSSFNGFSTQIQRPDPLQYAATDKMNATWPQETPVDFRTDFCRIRAQGQSETSIGNRSAGTESASDIVDQAEDRAKLKRIKMTGGSLPLKKRRLETAGQKAEKNQLLQKPKLTSFDKLAELDKRLKTAEVEPYCELMRRDSTQHMITRVLNPCYQMGSSGPVERRDVQLAGVLQPVARYPSQSITERHTASSVTRQSEAAHQLQLPGLLPVSSAAQQVRPGAAVAPVAPAVQALFKAYEDSYHSAAKRPYTIEPPSHRSAISGYQTTPRAITKAGGKGVAATTIAAVKSSAYKQMPPYMGPYPEYHHQAPSHYQYHDLYSASSQIASDFSTPKQAAPVQAAGPAVAAAAPQRGRDLVAAQPAGGRTRPQRPQPGSAAAATWYDNTCYYEPLSGWSMPSAGSGRFPSYHQPPTGYSQAQAPVQRHQWHPPHGQQLPGQQASSVSQLPPQYMAGHNYYPFLNQAASLCTPGDHWSMSSPSATEWAYGTGYRPGV